jgi:tripartite-type tricarboxylate transporter receptor subunit TctC
VKRLALPGFCLSVAGLCLVVAPSMAADNNFYAGKQIRLLVGTDATGTYNSHARVVAAHIGKYIPGNPTIVVQNMAGAASIRMANYVYSAAPRDGTVIGTGQNTIPTSPLTSPKEALYDPNKLNWIGSATRENYVGYVWHSAPLQKFEEAKTKEILMGGSAVGTFSIDSALIANEIFGTKFKAIIGYKSSAETKLAVERGEVQGVMATNWLGLKKEEAWMKNNSVRLIVQYGLKKNTEISPDIPLYIDFAKTEAELEVAKFWVSVLEHGKPYFVPPEVPADRVAILRKAFDDTMKDPAFLADIATAGENVDRPMTGQEMAALVADENRTSPAVIERIQKTIQRFHEEGVKK